MPTIHLVFSVPPAGAGVVRDWLATLPGDTAVITSESSSIADWDLGVPVFTDRQVIPVASPVDERVWRENEMHRRTLKHRLGDYQFLSVPLINDLEIATRQRYEDPAVMARAAAALIRRGYDQVAVVLDVYLDNYAAILREACACDTAPVDAVPLQFTQGALRPAPRFMRRVPFGPWLDALRPGPAMSDAQRALLAEQYGGATGGTIVLLTSTAPSYTEPVAEIVRALRGRSEQVHVIALSASIQAAWREEYDIASELLLPEDNRDPADRDSIIDALNAFLSAFQTDTDQRLDAIGHRSPLFVGLRTADFVDAASYHLDFYMQLFRHAVMIERLEMILRLARPVGIYSPPVGGDLEYAVPHLCRRHGTRSVVSIDDELSASRHSNYAAEFITVAGDENVAAFAERGHPATNIVPVGQVQLDSVVRTWTRERARAYLQEMIPELDPTSKIAMVVSNSIDPDSEAEWIEDLGEIARQRGDLEVVVRTDEVRQHAAYKPNVDRRPDLPIRFLIGRPDNVHAGLAAADLVFTNHSPVGKLALFHGKPLIVVNFTGAAFADNRFDEEGVALRAANVAELRRATHRLLDSAVARAKLAENYPAYLRRYFTSNDGHSADRVADLLLGTNGPHWAADGAPTGMHSRPGARPITPGNPTSRPIG